MEKRRDIKNMKEEHMHLVNVAEEDAEDRIR